MMTKKDYITDKSEPVHGSHAKKKEVEKDYIIDDSEPVHGSHATKKKDK